MTNGSDNSHNEPVRRRINDPSSPYYMTGSNFPGLNICGMMLRGENNYHEWAVATKNGFRALANAVTEKDEEGSSVQKEDGRVPGFTDEQWQGLIKFLEKSKISAPTEKLTGPAYKDADWSR
ncbi:unnamed protein product [Cuscuta europaea]|uniref:Retrotransposon Copia-like N-terminal domain-containing protein n=1 Tax=Cuscuta europaea TaxID=41803 RepID=A0A9P1E6L5_CUSEU|nr:unnamed protein product [Cuscuta europaea]